jgi:16S rRNA (guanine966-N2)-methyltransferase
MRIVAGRLGGRNFTTPRSARTHPMSDRVRGALFNTLGDVEGLTFLDAFAGTGALSFEAISRGAASALMIEIDRPAQRSIQESIGMLDVRSQAKLVSANNSGWSDKNQEQRFDIVIAAPPYDDLQLPIVQKLSRHVADDGLFVLDWPGKMEAPVIPAMEIIEQKNYGDAQLVFYR